MASAIFRLSIPSAVHPHTRGDDIRTSLKSGGIIGSPPHAWGRLYGPRKDSPRQRFTPTRVGTTLALQECQFSCSVHPHTRGDDVARHQELRGHIGSPPHAWGRLPQNGLTHSRGSVHPHTRGDDGSPSASASSSFGSPPHAWGRRHWSFLQTLASRFTPTRVGTTSIPPLSPQVKTVHPHTRGDDVRKGFVRFMVRGSPPHAWGRLPGRCVKHSQNRFTPTRVGAAKERRLGEKRDAGRPHTRGDDGGTMAARTEISGSPPHAWGRRGDGF